MVAKNPTRCGAAIAKGGSVGKREKALPLDFADYM
jgi:hypothetical protein